jgi:hypothetical protein
VTMLVTALGRTLGPSQGTVRFGDDLDRDRGAPLPTGRGETESWEFIPS